MAIKIGGIDIVNTLIRLESQLKFHEKIINWIYENHSDFRMPDKHTLSRFKEECLSELKSQYPEVRIGMKKIVYVDCKKCKNRFKSPIQCDENVFETCDIKSNSYSCPICKSQETYSKDDLYFDY